MNGTLVLGSATWLTVVTILLLTGIGLVVWRYLHSPPNGLTDWLAPLLKILGLVLLGLCLLEPLWSGQRAAPGANLFVILADDSQSLSMKDPGANSTRGEKLKKLLNAEEAPWQIRLAQDFEQSDRSPESHQRSIPGSAACGSASFHRRNRDRQQTVGPEPAKFTSHLSCASGSGQYWTPGL